MPVAVLIATDLLFTEHTTAARAEEHPILPLMDGQAGELNPPAILPHATVRFQICFWKSSQEKIFTRHIMENTSVLSLGRREAVTAGRGDYERRLARSGQPGVGEYTMQGVLSSVTFRQCIYNLALLNFP